MPWLHIVCGMFVAPIRQLLFPKRRPHGFYASRTATSHFLAHYKVIASLAFLKLDIKLFNTLRVHRKVTVWWPWGDIWFLPCLRRLENCTTASGRLCGGRMPPLRRPYGEFVVAATIVMVSYGLSMVASRSPCGHLTFFISWIVRSPCGRHNIFDHSL